MSMVNEDSQEKTKVGQNIVSGLRVKSITLKKYRK
jgi:hypothetical protein